MDTLPAINQESHEKVNDYDNDDDILKSLMQDLESLHDDLGSTKIALQDDRVLMEEIENDSVQICTETEQRKRKRRNICEECNVELSAIDGLWRKCPSCGSMSKIIGNDMENCDSIRSYNSMTDSSVPARIRGTGLVKAGLNKCFMRSSVDSRKQRRSKIIENIARIAFNNNSSIPQIHIEEAVNSYCDIARRAAAISGEKYVYRGTGQRGMLAIFVEQVCLDHDIRLFNHDLIKAFDVSESDLSKARRRMRNLSERGLIYMNKIENKCEITLKSFMKDLRLDKKYVPFLYAIINRAEEKKIHILESTTEKTKCAGVIYLLTTCIYELYLSTSQERISAKCGVSIPTFMKYYNLLIKHKPALKHTFKKNKIPMPAIWNTSRSHSQSDSSESDSD